MLTRFVQNRAAGYLSAVLGIAAVTAIAAPFHDQLNNTTVALALVLVVLFIATLWGRGPGMLASLLGMLCFNFFFLPPLYTFTIADPQNWIALAAFLITAITAGQLSAPQNGAHQRQRPTGRKRSWPAPTTEARSRRVSIPRDHRCRREDYRRERRHRTVTGRSRVELIAHRLLHLFHRAEKNEAGYQQVLSDGFVRDYALELRHRDGHITSVLYNASLYRDDSGRVTGVFAAARDITERKRAEAELRESERRMRLIIDTALDAVIAINSQGEITEWNPQAEIIFGWSHQEAIGRTLADLVIPPQYRDAHARGFQQIPWRPAKGHC